MCGSIEPDCLRERRGPSPGPSPLAKCEGRGRSGSLSPFSRGEGRERGSYSRYNGQPATHRSAQELEGQRGMFEWLRRFLLITDTNCRSIAIQIGSSVFTCVTNWA